MINCRMEREYKKMGIHLNQFMGSSSSIGAKRVTNVCAAFRAATDQSNRAGYRYLTSSQNSCISPLFLLFINPTNEKKKMLFSVCLARTLTKTSTKFKKFIHLLQCNISTIQIVYLMASYLVKILKK